MALAGFAIAVFGPELLRVMVPKGFVSPALLLPVVMLACVVRDVADFFCSLLLINKRSVWVGQIALAAAALNPLSNMPLIPAYGIHGAAWAALLTWSATSSSAGSSQIGSTCPSASPPTLACSA